MKLSNGCFFQFQIQNGKICPKTNDKTNTGFTNSPYNVEILNAKENSLFNINGVKFSFYFKSISKLILNIHLNSLNVKVLNLNEYEMS